MFGASSVSWCKEMFAGDSMVWLLAASVAVVFQAIWGRWWSRWLGPNRFSVAREKLADQREALELEFLRKANERGIPRGLTWSNCDFGAEVWLVVNQGVGQLQALVEVTISFEAEPGGDMEGVEAVGNLRAATAIFFTDARSPGEWRTDGRAIFNLDPQQAIERFQDELTVIPEKVLR